MFENYSSTSFFCYCLPPGQPPPSMFQRPAMLSYKASATIRHLSTPRLSFRPAYQCAASPNVSEGAADHCVLFGNCTSSRQCSNACLRPLAPMLE
eukprot:6783901-Karenia_brevis.AAC.1